MQHIAHIFIGEELVSFRNLFASFYRKLHPDYENSLFSAISITEDEDGRYQLSPSEMETIEGITVDKDNRQSVLYNFFEEMYRQKVTVAHPGNHSLVVVLWAKLFTSDNINIIQELSSAIIRSDSNFHIEFTGFTHDAVSCFIPNPIDRLSPDIYQNIFYNNIEKLRKLRHIFSAFRLISNRNMNGVALDLNEDAMARLCAEHSALMCEHYLSIRPNVIEFQGFPFESFGISSILFDLEYYKSYIKNRLIVDKMANQGIENTAYSINALATHTNPIIKEILDEIQGFNNQQAAHAKAQLALKGSNSISDIVGEIDNQVKEIAKNLEDKINTLLSSGKISIFESEALLALILGEDCSMFDGNAIDADEETIEDIINESANYFTNLDEGNTKLTPVSLNDIKTIRKRMRNIAVANRQREERLKVLNTQIKDSIAEQKHLDKNIYRFGGIGYNVDLNIDTEHLELTYEPHDVHSESIDLTNNFAPIRNQGKQGSCAAFAVASVIEALRNDSNRYSPAYLYWSAREAKGATGIDSGATLNNVINGAARKGICTEELMPYNPDIYALSPTEEATKEAQNCLILEAKTVAPKLRDIKSALCDGYPVIIAAKIFDSFSDTRSGFIRHPSNEEIAEGTRTDGHGNHAMVVCGFSDKERILIVRNSWGTNFGDNGYCYIPYSYAQKYFLQACIITKISSSESTQLTQNENTLNFNLGDANIETAILRNLIEEDKYELQILAEESARLRTYWAQNIATLGNANNMAEIIKKSHAKIDNEITDINSNIEKLQSSEPEKIRTYKKRYIKGFILIGVILVISLLLIYFKPSLYTTIIAGVIGLVLAIGVGAYSYNWRKFRQDLRDEILNLANQITQLQQKKIDQKIDTHIYGTILRETENYRLDLLYKYQTLKKYNRAWRDLYKNIQIELKNMTPTVPYPFLSVMENNLLEQYYTNWKDKMIDYLCLKSFYNDFSEGNNLNQILHNNLSLNNSIIRGLKDFSMKEYITRKNLEKWQFLPSTSEMGEVIQNLDARAIPFYPYNNPESDHLEKYLFVKDVTQDEINNISRFFTLSPKAISSSNPYSICVLNVVRYNLPNPTIQ